MVVIILQLWPLQGLRADSVMKVAFVDQYADSSILHKDPITIPLAMREQGCGVTLVNASIKPAATQIAGLDVYHRSAFDLAIWEEEKFDFAIFFSRFESRFDEAIQAAKNSGTRVMLKGDTDGTLGYPLVPNYLRARPFSEAPLLNLLRNIKWRLPLNASVGKKIRQIRQADAVIVESPGAAVNLSQILCHWRLPHHSAKIHFVPNPVSSEVLKAPLKEKRKTILAAGRWDDQYVKNTATMISAIKSFLDIRTDYTFELYGPGLNNVGLLAEFSEYIKSDRVVVSDWLNHDELQNRIRSSRTVLIPSTLESYCLTAAEALCCGTSVVVTPIESLIYLAGGGAFGSIARGFKQNDLLAALIYESYCWDQGVRDPLVISKYWKDRMDSQAVAKQYLNILENS